MNTSYFAKSGTHKNAVAISAKVPEFYKGKRYTKLAPSWSIYSEWKESGDDERYTRRYNEEILGKLNPHEVYCDLGPEAILICYESSEKFCHRHLVAKWLMKHLNFLHITEL